MPDQLTQTIFIELAADIVAAYVRKTLFLKQSFRR